MIFVTVGSSSFDFSRLVGALGCVDPEELVIQHGPASPPPARRAFAFVPFDEVNRLMAEADLVVCHARVGSVLCALRYGHVPIVVPRLSRHRETVDDHQVELALALGEQGRVVPVLDVAELPAALRAAPRRQPASPVGRRPLHAAVRHALFGTTEQLAA